MKRLILFLLAALLFSCTDNEMVRNFGSTKEYKLKPNEKVLTVTFKDHDIWILTRDTVTGVSYFREKSALGLMEGTIIIK